MPASVPSAHGRVAILTRHHGPDDPVTLDAKRDLEAVKLEEYIRRVVDQAPSLTADQRDRLAALLRPTGHTPDGAA